MDCVSDYLLMCDMLWWWPSSRCIGYRCEDCYGACHSERKRPRNSKSHSGYCDDGKALGRAIRRYVILSTDSAIKIGRRYDEKYKTTFVFNRCRNVHVARISGLNEELSTWGWQTQRHQDAETMPIKKIESERWKQSSVWNTSNTSMQSHWTA